MFLITESVFRYTTRKDKLIILIKIKFYYSSSVAFVTVLQNPVLPSLTQLSSSSCKELGSIQISRKLQCISQRKVLLLAP